MTIEEITKGESKNVEFKVALPKESEKYIKTIVAFANTQGGKLVIGIDDESLEVVGVENDTAFEVMDSIANAVSDSVTPQLIPNIELQTINDKTVVVVSVEPSMGRPYYIKSKGRDKGTYVRVGGTTRPAHSEKIKELEMEGSGISWDELTCIGFEVTDIQIKKLCKDIMEYRKASGLSNREVSEQQLINWKLLKKAENNFLATNAFALLTSDHFPLSKTQCAVFKGRERTVFVDKKVLEGPLYEQIDEAVKFVLRNIRLGAKIQGLLRKESYELPPEAIREIIINAHCHRNFTENSCVQVAIYSDRLEVTSPGGLYGGITLEDILKGHSKLRNKAIANIFAQMGLAEAWGTGLIRVWEYAKKYGLKEPEVVETSGLFRVNLYRSYPGLKNDGEVVADVGDNDGNDGEVVADVGDNDGDDGENVGDVGNNVGDVGDNDGDVGNNVGDVGETSDRNIELRILDLINENNKISAADIATLLSVSKRTVERYLKKLRETGKLQRFGSPRNGYWMVNT
ncbi:MAG: putative DNA binding domain-containing protein [Firmicutes bacterium]|nr:putative DNA binding domain-containing protein [Bacillota bacterium]